MTTRPILIVANQFHAPTIERLDQAFETVHLWKLSHEAKLAKLAELEGRCHAAASASWATDPLLYTLKSLQLIACFGVGVDGIDFRKTAELGIRVSNTPGVLDDAVAEIALGLVLSCARRLVRADSFVRAGSWQQGPFPFGMGLAGKTVGIAGLGRIGLEIAKRCESFKMRVTYHNRSPREIDYDYYSSLEDLAAASDILINVLPGGHATANRLGTEVFRALGPKGLFINVGRGQSVDELALVKALEAGEIAGAGLDVYAQEPNVPAALTGRDDVVLLPHIGSSTKETRMAMGELVRQNLDAFFRDDPLISEVS